MISCKVLWKKKGLDTTTFPELCEIRPSSIIWCLWRLVSNTLKHLNVDADWAAQLFRHSFFRLSQTPQSCQSEESWAAQRTLHQKQQQQNLTKAARLTPLCHLKSLPWQVRYKSCRVRSFAFGVCCSRNIQTVQHHWHQPNTALCRLLPKSDIRHAGQCRSGRYSRCQQLHHPLFTVVFFNLDALLPNVQWRSAL